MSDRKINGDLMALKEQSLSARTTAKIAKAELENNGARSALETAAASSVAAKQNFEDLRRLTAAIKNLAPLIRDEVNSLERLWHQAEERKGKAAESVELANKELKSAYLAREQLTQIGLYTASDQTLPTSIDATLFGEHGDRPIIKIPMRDQAGR